MLGPRCISAVPCVKPFPSNQINPVWRMRRIADSAIPSCTPSSSNEQPAGAGSAVVENASPTRSSSGGSQDGQHFNQASDRTTRDHGQSQAARLVKLLQPRPDT